MIVVPPEYVFVPLSVNSPLPVNARALLLMMFPAKVVAEPADEATVERRGVRRLAVPTTAPADPLRLPTVCGTPSMSNTPLEAMVKAVAVGRFSPPPSSRQRSLAEIVVAPL